MEQVGSGPSITHESVLLRQKNRGLQQTSCLLQSAGGTQKKEITRPCRRWQSPPRGLWDWGVKWTMDSSATHQCPRTRTSAAGVKLKYMLAGDKIYIYWSIPQQKCLTVMWDYWLPTDWGVTLLNTPALVSHNCGLITASDTWGRVCVRACVTPFPHTAPVQRKRLASAVTHLYRLQAGERWSGTSEVRSAVETLWVSRHRKCAGRWQADGASSLLAPAPKVSDAHCSICNSIDLIIDYAIRVTLYREIQKCINQRWATLCFTFGLRLKLCVLTVGRYYSIWKGERLIPLLAARGQVRRFEFTLLEVFKIYFTHFFSFSRLLLNHGPRDVQELIAEPVIIFERMRVEGKLI